MPCPLHSQWIFHSVIFVSNLATRRRHSSEEKIRILLGGLRGEDSTAVLCRREGLNQNVYYRWSKEFLETGKKRLANRVSARRKIKLRRGIATHYWSRSFFNSIGQSLPKCDVRVRSAFSLNCRRGTAAPRTVAMGLGCVKTILHVILAQD